MATEPSLYFSCDESYSEVDIYRTTINKRGETVYLLKISLTDIGLYIQGLTLTKKQNGDLWLQLPRYNSGGNWRWPLECDKSKPFFQLVNKLATDYVQRFTAELDVVNDDFDPDKPIDFKDLPF